MTSDAQVGKPRNPGVLVRGHQAVRRQGFALDSETPAPASAQIISAVPFHEWLAVLRADHAAYSRNTPNADVTALIGTMVSRLAATIEMAADTTVYMKVDDVAKRTKMPPSTLRRLCQRHGAAIGASRISGTWTIAWSTFEQFMKKYKPTKPEEAV